MEKDNNITDVKRFNAFLQALSESKLGVRGKVKILRRYIDELIDKNENT